MYRLTKDKVIIRKADGACIPEDFLNIDYTDYLTWVAEGGVPEEEPVPVRTLVEEKIKRTEACDAKTQQIILRGFELNGKKYSTSMPAQLNYIAKQMQLLSGVATFPFKWSTVEVDGEGFVEISTEEEWSTLLSAAISNVEGEKIQGIQLRALIQAATTLEELDAIVDTRE